MDVSIKVLKEYLSFMNQVNILSYIVYALVFVSMIIGIKRASKNQLNENAFSLEAMTSLKGVMALFVLFHHMAQQSIFQISSNYNAEKNFATVVPFFEFIGFLFVAVFFFCSGYGLYRSLSIKENYLKGFLKKRVLPIIISYYVMIAIYAAYYLIVGSDFTLTQWILKVTGLILINSQSWYVYVICLMYVVFYLVFRKNRDNKAGIWILLAVALLQGLLFIVNGHFPWWLMKPSWNIALFSPDTPWWQKPCQLLFEGEWWVNSTVAFVLGIFIAQKQNSFIEWAKKCYWFKFAVITILFVVINGAGIVTLWEVGYWTEFSGNLGTLNKAICYCVQQLQVIITCLFVIMLMQKVYVQNRLYNTLGKISLEFYLMQELVLFSTYFIIKTPADMENPSIWPVAGWFVLVVAAVFASALIYHWINVLCTKKLKASK